MQHAIFFFLSTPSRKMDALNSSQIQRIVLLVDLHPFLVLGNTGPYLCNIAAAARRILAFPPLSSSLAAYKFFFSSLSPIVSTSKLRDLFGKSPTFLSFDRPIQTLESLLCTINSLASIHDSLQPGRSAYSRASFVAGSLLQLEHDYAWELHPLKHRGMFQSLMVRSNLVLLFSPIPQSLSSLSEYLSEGPLLSFQPFLSKFLQIFGLAKARLMPRDIHVSWIYVSSDGLGDEEWLGFSHFQSAMKKLGWGCYRTAAIILGSALVPFGLIFPYIGYTMDFKSLDHYKKDSAELILRIIDSNGAALECTMCDLGVIVLKLHGEKLDIPCLNPDKCGKKSMRICIREIREMNCIANTIENSCALILLHGISGATGTETAQSTEGEFITKTVLKLLCDELGVLDVGKPIWQIVLTFLYNKNCAALVSVSDDSGSLVSGILQPFTLNYALLSVFPRNIDIPLSAEIFSYDSRRGNKTNKNLLHDVSWSSFIERVFSQNDDFDSAIFLEKLYFTLPCARSKKFRFLKCWLKQIKGINFSPDSEGNELDNSSSVKGAIEEITSLQQQSECDFSTDDHCLSQPASHLASSFFSIDDSNAFLGSISQKIDHALCTKEVDLFILVERLVFASIDALSTKYGRSPVQELNLWKENDSFDTKIANELSNLLLVKPKDLELKCKSSASTSSTTEPISVIYSNEEKISLSGLGHASILSLNTSSEDNLFLALPANQIFSYKSAKTRVGLLNFFIINIDDI
ncbi:hypothetical protein KSP39_PZI015876 [Platanthera zijinensis]|uniref:Uncharacterized protein n=1 Tax=Platanthera zijinensis TaxID=2320716 RepID=A0AAP0B9G7_9ASPA